VTYRGWSVFDTPAEELVEYISGECRDRDYDEVEDFELDLAVWRPTLPSNYEPTEPDDGYRRGRYWMVIAIGHGGYFRESARRLAAIRDRRILNPVAAIIERGPGEAPSRRDLALHGMRRRVVVKPHAERAGEPSQPGERQGRWGDDAAEPRTRLGAGHPPSIMTSNLRNRSDRPVALRTLVATGRLNGPSASRVACRRGSRGVRSGHRQAARCLRTGSSVVELRVGVPHERPKHLLLGREFPLTFLPQPTTVVSG